LRALDDFTLPDGAVSLNCTAARAAWSVASAHTYGYSISPEDGAIAGVTAELVRRALGSSGDATAVTADGRVYFPALAPHHVFALRLAGGTATGDPTLGRTFHLGGAGPNIAPIDFGSGAISLLRGFPADSFAGSRVALMNADYRWPIARPQRGAGTWPVFVHTLHAAVFADAGHAWTRLLRRARSESRCRCRVVVRSDRRLLGAVRGDNRIA
jgi:outer membrane protein assembly factor BamA